MSERRQTVEIWVDMIGHDLQHLAVFDGDKLDIKVNIPSLDRHQAITVARIYFGQPPKEKRRKSERRVK